MGEQRRGLRAARPHRPRRSASSSARWEGGPRWEDVARRCNGRIKVVSVDDDEACELVSGADLVIGGDVDDEGEDVRAYLLRLPRRRARAALSPRAATREPPSPAAPPSDRARRRL
ncbi:Os01g0324600 [Oryza sativa Japonica Group]|uniref:Os01g0324600 protein n=1 Tax=Oryza sativa subsp. japonica TaxID=39947 RepID=A0A0P0V246_ORYSJ|nr:Os01g0324600 [Oryza sativa Japonica Group]